MGIPYIVYQHTEQQERHHFTNYANEATAYVQFIYDYYDCLPQAGVILIQLQLYSHAKAIDFYHMSAGYSFCSWARRRLAQS